MKSSIFIDLTELFKNWNLFRLQKEVSTVVGKKNTQSA